VQGQLSQQMPSYGAFSGGRANSGRQARALDEAAEAYLTEVRRLSPSPEADGLADELEALRRSLAGRAATY
jgi:thioesterase domain-containing protein